MTKLELYTYFDLSKIFSVQINTIRIWKSKGDFEIVGYRKLGPFRREAVVSEKEVKKLLRKQFLPPKGKRTVSI